MTAIQNFAFEDHLVRVVDRFDEPWFVGADICSILAIKNSRDALGRLDDDEKGVANTDTPGGPQEVTVISEPGVYRLTFTSRSKAAERFKRWLAHEVLPELRRSGACGEVQAARSTPIDHDAPLAARVDAVRLARSLFGRERAMALWGLMGLPEVPFVDSWGGQSAARGLIKHIGDQQIDGDGVRTLVMNAMDGDLNAQLKLNGFGIHATAEREGFLIGHRAPGIAALMSTGVYSADRSWVLLLRRLPGATTGERMSFAGVQTRTTWLPVEVLDYLADDLH